MRETIVLSGSEPIAAGTFRDCYRDPDHADRCIKIVRAGASRHRGHIARWLDRPMADPNRLERDEYRRHKHRKAALEAYFPRLYGFVKTDLGRGLSMELLQDAAGRPPVSVEHFVSGKADLPGLTDAQIVGDFAAFGSFCIESDIAAYCDELNNVGYLPDGDDGYRLVAFDMKHRVNKETLPVSTFVTFLRRQKIARRFRRSLARLQVRLRKRAEKAA